MKKENIAVKEFEKAIEVKSDNFIAYNAIAEIFK